VFKQFIWVSWPQFVKRSTALPQLIEQVVENSHIHSIVPPFPRPPSEIQVL